MEFDVGFADKNLWQMIRFTEVFPDGVIFVSLLRQSELPPRELLQKRLHEAIVRTRQRLEQQADGAILQKNQSKKNRANP